MFPRAAAGARNTPATPRHAAAACSSGAGRAACAGCREVFGELPVSCLAEEIETPGRGPGPGAGHAGRQPGALDARTAAASSARSSRSTSWSRSTSTSTRRRATPTSSCPAPSPLAARALRPRALPARRPQRRQLLAAAGRARARRAGRSGRRCCAWPAIAAGQGPDADVDALDGWSSSSWCGARRPTPRSPLAGRDAGRAAGRARARRGPERVLDMHAARRPLRRRVRRRRRRADARRARGQPARRRPRAAQPRLPDVLRTPAGKIELAPGADRRRRARGCALRSSAARNGEIVLIGRRQLRSNNSWMHNLSRW